MEVQGKVLAYGGVMLAFGLSIVAWFVIRPALAGRLPRVFALGSGIAHVAVAVGIGLLIVVSVALDLVKKINSHLVMRNYPGLTDD